MFHLLIWASQKSCGALKSTPAAEIMAASKALDELIHLRDARQKILKKQVIFWELVDSKYLHTSFSTQRNSVGESICGMVNCIQLTLEIELDSMGWIRGNFNPLDIGIKPNRH